MKKLSERPLLITIITVSSVLILYILVNLINYNDNTNESTGNSTLEYKVASYVLKNNQEEKVEKIIVDSNISSSTMKDIYEERKIENSNNKYTIWFFSSKEAAQNADTYELGSATEDNNKIEIINVKEEKEKEELARQQEEELQEQKRREEEEKVKAEQEEKNYKDSCKKITFEELARNPEKVKGTKVRLTGEVVQVSENNISIGMRVNITENEYGWYEDTVYIIYYPEDGEDKILEDDIITIYGTAEGEYSYTSVMGAYITIPKILAEYVEIN